MMGRQTAANVRGVDDKEVGFDCAVWLWFPSEKQKWSPSTLGAILHGTLIAADAIMTMLIGRSSVTARENVGRCECWLVLPHNLRYRGQVIEFAH